MAVIKVFTPTGVKTVKMLGNVDEQDYDSIEDDVETDDVPVERNPFE